MYEDEQGRAVARNRYVPTTRQREVVMMLSANHVPREIIAKALDISARTLDRHFQGEMKNGREHMVARVGITVLRKALRGNMNAARFWLTTHGGPEWRQATKDAAADAMAFATSASVTSGKKVQFYLPKNGRDQPETNSMVIDVDGVDEDEEAA